MTDHISDNFCFNVKRVERRGDGETDQERRVFWKSCLKTGLLIAS